MLNELFILYFKSGIRKNTFNLIDSAEFFFLYKHTHYFNKLINRKSSFILKPGYSLNNIFNNLKYNTLNCYYYLYYSLFSKSSIMGIFFFEGFRYYRIYPNFFNYLLSCNKLFFELNDKFTELLPFVDPLLKGKARGQNRWIAEGNRSLLEYNFIFRRSRKIFRKKIRFLRYKKTLVSSVRSKSLRYSMSKYKWSFDSWITFMNRYIQRQMELCRKRGIKPKIPGGRRGPMGKISNLSNSRYRTWILDQSSDHNKPINGKYANMVLKENAKRLAKDKQKQKEREAERKRMNLKVVHSKKRLKNEKKYKDYTSELKIKYLNKFNLKRPYNFRFGHKFRKNKGFFRFNLKSIDKKIIFLLSRQTVELFNDGIGFNLDNLVSKRWFFLSRLQLDISYLFNNIYGGVKFVKNLYLSAFKNRNKMFFDYSSYLIHDYTKFDNVGDLHIGKFHVYSYMGVYYSALINRGSILAFGIFKLLYSFFWTIFIKNYFMFYFFDQKRYKLHGNFMYRGIIENGFNTIRQVLMLQVNDDMALNTLGWSNDSFIFSFDSVICGFGADYNKIDRLKWSAMFLNFLNFYSFLKIFIDNYEDMLIVDSGAHNSVYNMGSRIGESVAKLRHLFSYYIWYLIYMFFFANRYVNYILDMYYGLAFMTRYLEKGDIIWSNQDILVGFKGLVVWRIILVYYFRLVHFFFNLSLLSAMGAGNHTKFIKVIRHKGVLNFLFQGISEVEFIRRRELRVNLDTSVSLKGGTIYNQVLMIFKLLNNIKNGVGKLRVKMGRTMVVPLYKKFKRDRDLELIKFMTPFNFNFGVSSYVGFLRGYLVCVIFALELSILDGNIPFHKIFTMDMEFTHNFISGWLISSVYIFFFCYNFFNMFFMRWLSLNIEYTNSLQEYMYSLKPFYFNTLFQGRTLFSNLDYTGNSIRNWMNRLRDLYEMYHKSFHSTESFFREKNFKNDLLNYRDAVRNLDEIFQIGNALDPVKSYHYIELEEYSNISSYLYEVTRLYKGYKLAGLGRFTRKQRKSYIWFQRGCITLNSLDTYVDYARYTIPLINSICSIRVWLRVYPIKNSFNFILS